MVNQARDMLLNVFVPTDTLKLRFCSLEVSPDGSWFMYIYIYTYFYIVTIRFKPHQMVSTVGRKHFCNFPFTDHCTG